MEQGAYRPQSAHGSIPAQKTALIMPEVRPEFVPFMKSNTQSYQSNKPHQPQPVELKTYESFEPSKTVKHPFYFAEQEHAERVQKSSIRNCPNCLQCIANFKLPNDPTDSVFCATCRQPYHFCPIHGNSLPGMGLNRRDPETKQCQCTKSLTFLGDNNWDSCFNK
jgi:hypothetical protein